MGAYTIEDLINTIDSFDTDLERERSTSSNPWIALFTTRVAVLKWITDELEGYKDRDILRERIDALLLKKEEVSRKHGFDPADEIKQELIQDFKTLLNPEANPATS